jgi:hypothetical protein
LLRAIEAFEGEEDGSMAMLANLVSTYGAHEGSEVRRWVSIGRECLAEAQADQTSS